jgi:hypothetical protein
MLLDNHYSRSDLTLIFCRSPNLTGNSAVLRRGHISSEKIEFLLDQMEIDAKEILAAIERLKGRI